MLDRNTPVRCSTRFDIIVFTLNERSLKLAMQTGAFIQLILTLVAVTSRMDALVPELRDSLGLTSRASHRILQLLDVRPPLR